MNAILAHNKCAIITILQVVSSEVKKVANDIHGIESASSNVEAEQRVSRSQKRKVKTPPIFV